MILLVSGEAMRDPRRVAIHAISVLLLAVTAAPFLYQGGKGFAEVALSREVGMPTGRLVEWVQSSRFELSGFNLRWMLE